jgi:hypothetical protein
MTTMTILWIILGLFTKHPIVDFLMQGPFQYRNKGTYGHPGGILHSFNHLIGTLLVLVYPCSIVTAATLAAVDGVVHYHIDWAKMSLNKKLGWGPTTHEQFWWLLGVDQYLHAITYISFAFYLAS